MARVWRATLTEKFAPYFEAKARELLASNEITLNTTNGTVRARLIRFRNGAVLEQKRESPTGAGAGRTRIERPQLTEPIITSYLVQALMSLGGEPRPMD